MSTLGVLLAIASGGLLYSVRKLSRLGRLKFAYALGWGIIGVLGLLAPIGAVLIERLAVSLDLPVGTLIVFVGAVFLVSLSMQLSVSVSGLSRQIEEISARVAEIDYSTNSDEAKVESS